MGKSLDINNGFIVGRLTQDSELRDINGKAVLKFSIANNRWNDHVNYFKCSLWGSRASGLHKFLNTGVRVGLTGEWRQTKWEQDGVKKTGFEFIVDNLQFFNTQNKDKKEEILF